MVSSTQVQAGSRSTELKSSHLTPHIEIHRAGHGVPSGLKHLMVTSSGIEEVDTLFWSAVCRIRLERWMRQKNTTDRKSMVFAAQLCWPRSCQMHRVDSGQFARCFSELSGLPISPH